MTPRTEPDAHPGLTDPRWELAQRVASSRAFERSARMRRFLLYICERSLSGRSDQIIEQQIGAAVFDRKPDYNPNDDNIVRVEARTLRKRLEEHFEQDGRDEPIVITVPKGGYSPAFHPRTPAVKTKPSAAGPRVSARLPWLLSGLLLAAVVVLLVRDIGRHRQVGNPILLDLLEPAGQTLVALADSNFVLYQDLTRRDVRLDDYLGARYLAGETDPALRTLAQRQYTSLADATLAARIAAARSPTPTVVRFARSLNVRDFQSGNAIILGGKRANPWAEMFEPQLNFIPVYEAQTHSIYFANKAPLDGEQARYVMQSADGKPGQSYGLISLVPNLARNGRVLILQGLNMEGTEAVGEFALTPGLTEKLLEAIGAAKDRPLPSFEALVRLQAVRGAAKDTEIIAVRRWAR